MDTTILFFKMFQNNQLFIEIVSNITSYLYNKNWIKLSERLNKGQINHTCNKIKTNVTYSTPVTFVFILLHVWLIFPLLLLLIYI